MENLTSPFRSLSKRKNFPAEEDSPKVFSTYVHGMSWPLLQYDEEKDVAENRRCFLKIVSNLRFFARQQSNGNPQFEAGK